MAADVKRLAGERLFGPAFPVRTMAGDSSTLHRAVAAAPSGSVLVVDAGAYTDRAVWGEVLTIAAMVRGLEGAVIDGAVRDIDAIRRLAFPLFARGHTPAGPHKGWMGDMGGPVSCGGVVVEEGDLVVGDGDGVVVVPHAHATEVRLAINNRVELEDEWLRRIRAGEPSYAVLGLHEASGAEDSQ
jgi:regulator of RNase E activity RraA